MPAKYPDAIDPSAAIGGPNADGQSTEDRDAISLQHLNHAVVYFSDVDDADTYTLGTTSTSTTSNAENRIVRCAWEPASATDEVGAVVTSARVVTFNAAAANNAGWLHLWHS